MMIISGFDSFFDGKYIFIFVHKIAQIKYIE